MIFSVFILSLYMIRKHEKRQFLFCSSLVSLTLPFIKNIFLLKTGEINDNLQQVLVQHPAYSVYFMCNPALADVQVAGIGWENRYTNQPTIVERLISVPQSLCLPAMSL